MSGLSAQRIIRTQAAFKKRKLKVGRRLPHSQNETHVKVQVKHLHLSEQFATHASQNSIDSNEAVSKLITEIEVCFKLFSRKGRFCTPCLPRLKDFYL
jgi:hypothetical protein